MFHPLQYAGDVRIPPAKMQLRVRREVNTHDAVNTRQFEAWQASVPVPQGEFLQVKDGRILKGREALAPVAYDMAPLSSRTDKRDYRQSVPFDVNGPSLAMNPYFDRYDPTRDPRNAIRELRGVVYEEKESDRGLRESGCLLSRAAMNRWMPEGASEDDFRASLQAYEVMRPKMDNIGEQYRGAGAPSSMDSVPFKVVVPDQSAEGGKRVSTYRAPVLTELPRTT